MTDDTMTPAWVVENYLPNYEMRLQEWRYGHSHVERMGLTESTFRHEHFREALDAFAKSICERQREICQDVVNENYDTRMDYAQKAQIFEQLYRNDTILFAPMPEITKNR